MTPQQYAQLPEYLAMRELRYRVYQKGLRVKTITLVTTLVDAQHYGLQDGADLCFARWGAETHFAPLKTTMGLEVLTCKTVNGMLKELMAFTLIYNVVRLVMGQAARRQHVGIERISFIDNAAKLTNYPFDIVCDAALRYKAMSPETRRTGYGYLNVRAHRAIGHS